MQKILYLNIIILLFIGVNVFGSFAWQIEGGEVSFIQSLLPGLYVLIGMFIFKFFTTNSKFFYQQKKEEFNLLFFLLFVVVLKSAWGHSGYLGGIFNALFLPVILSSLIPVRRFKKDFYVNKDFKYIIQKIIIYFFIIECSIAIFERILLINLFPVGSGEVVGQLSNQMETGEFRSSALINHPLQNALSVSIIMSFILISTIRDSYKYLLWVLGFLAILCFNTRSSIFMWIILLSVFVIHTVFISKKTSIRRKGFLIWSSLFMVVFLSYLVFGYGLGARILNMGLLDEGSSAVRIKIWDVFDKNNWGYFLIGHDNIEIFKMIKMVDIDIIENYWLIYIFTYGLILTIGIVYFFSKLFKRLLMGFSSFSKAFVLGCFLLISSTNNSLAVASPAMAIFLLCCYIFNPSIKNIDKKIKI